MRKIAVGSVGTSPLLVFVVLMLVTFALYWQSFGHGWTLDDNVVILGNPDVQSWGGFLADSYPGRPLRELTFLFDHALFGLNPAGWHVQSIAWHGLNGFLLYVLAHRLTGSRIGAWCAALLFLVHPLQVEAVANLANRKDSLALAFMFLSMLCYVQGFRQRQRQWHWTVAAVGLGVIACLAKQNAIVLPLLALAYEGALVESGDRWLLQRPRWAGVMLVFGGIAVLVWYVWLGGQARHMSTMPEVMAKVNKTFTGESIVPYLLMMFKSWAFMFGKIGWPLQLGPEYTYPAPKGWLDPWVVAALSAVVGSLLLMVAAWRKGWSLLLFGIGWFWLCWLPVSNLWPFAYFAADRYLYTPLVGLCLLAGWLVAITARRATWLPLGVMGGIGLLLAGLSWQQNRVWHSNETLWRQAVQVNPGSTTALNNLGQVLLAQGELEQARKLFQEAAGNFNDPMPYYNLARTFEQLGNRDKAIFYYRNFLAFNDPKYRQLAVEVRGRLLQFGILSR